MFCVVCRFVVYRVADGRRKEERGRGKRKGEKRKEGGRLEQLKWGDGDGGGGGGWRLQKQCP